MTVFDQLLPLVPVFMGGVAIGLEVMLIIIRKQLKEAGLWKLYLKWLNDTKGDKEHFAYTN